MLQMPVSEIVAKICEKSNVPKNKVQDMIKGKIDEHDGLVSEEGAAHIVANELGVKLFEKQVSGETIKVKEIVLGMKNVDVIGKVTRIFEPRTFMREGKENKVGNFILADETGSIRMVLWDNRRIDWFVDGTVKIGDVVHVKNGYVRNNKFSGMEVHLGMRGQLILDVGAEINVKVSEPTESESGSTSQEVKISNIAAGGSYKIRGTVVAAFNPNFYNACPTCNKKVEEAEKPSCTEHGEVTPAAAMVLNIVIDDGTGNIRCTAFRNTATIMVGKSAEELKGLGEELTTTVNDALLGTEIEIEGSVRENKMFGRTELLINNFSKPDPKVIVEKLLKSKGE